MSGNMSTRASERESSVQQGLAAWAILPTQRTAAAFLLIECSTHQRVLNAARR